MKYVINEKITAAISALQDAGTWPRVSLPDFDINYPQHREHGDYAVNAAMVFAKALQRSPRDIAEEIIANIPMDGLDRVEIAGPGFINIFINNTFFNGGLRYILEEAENYGKNTVGVKEDGTPTKVVVEFISANPTGPPHLGNGRGGFTGDAIVRTMRNAGFDVTAEYIINDFGNQVDTLAESVLRRYLQEQGIKIDFPEHLYQGEYITDLAKELDLKDVPLGNQEAMQEIRDEVKEWALQRMVKIIQELVEDKLHIKFDVWMSEKSLHNTKLVDRVQQFLKEHDLTYEQEGAVFFATTRYGDDKDRVLIKSDGESTYFFSDILYLFEKFEDRKIDHWVWLLGADHHGYKGRMEAALEAMGHKGKMDILFVQLVRLMFNGKELRMSKRKGTFVTLDELIDEVGIDVARWFFIQHEPNTHMDFDLNLAREHSDKNPVFYVQYAHARISSLLKQVHEVVGGNIESTIAVTNAAEEELAKTLFKFPELAEEIATSYEVHKLTHYATEVARAFHKFYTVSRVIDNDEVNHSRVNITRATQIVLRNCLELMGISAPDSM